MEILTRSAVFEVITRIGTAAKTLQAEIHQAAVSTLDHTREHGDYRGALALVNALPNGQRVQGLIVWFEHFSSGALKFKANKDGAGFSAKLSAERSEDDFDIAAAMLTDYGTFTKEAKPATFTVDKLIKMLESKANDDRTNDDGTPKVEPSARSVAAKFVRTYREAVSAAIN